MNLGKQIFHQLAAEQKLAQVRNIKNNSLKYFTGGSTISSIFKVDGGYQDRIKA